MRKKNQEFNNWAKYHDIKWLAEKANKNVRVIYYYIDGSRSPSKETMKRFEKLSKGDVPISSWF